ncbi:hypothetical protein [Streptomyces sp. ICN441]|uniref:hypothetical protein n=1 Tax=Streptomyces sp. ICN441 TaxID=2558286 RepID=UPI0023EA6FB1|nr:hypothetical protein [Streptomyces sp. ICN441]
MPNRGNTAAERLVHGAGIKEALGAADPDAWLEFDEEVRVVRPDEPGRRSPDPARVPALALCHRDGRVREAALERVADHPDLLPLLVIRTADWAEPVRARARGLLPGLLAAAGPESLVQLTALVLRLSRRERGGFALESLTALLRSAGPARLEPLLASPDRRTRRFAYGLAVERGLLPADRLARAAAEDDDAVVQRLCAEAALRSGPTRDDVILALVRSRHPAARSAGVTALRRAGRHDEARPYLTDRSGLVRACARYVLRQGGIEPLPLYRALCADPADHGIPAWAPLGLAECGEAADAALLWPLTGHPVPSVRARAVAGLRLLGRVDLDRLRPLLDDPAPAVTRETATTLLPWAGRLPEDRLLNRATDDRSPAHTRRAAFRLLRARGGVAELRAAVALLDGPDRALATLARSLIQQWEPPVGGHHDPAELDALLDRCAHLFSGYALLRLRSRAGLSGRPRADGEAGTAGTAGEPGTAREAATVRGPGAVADPGAAVGPGAGSPVPSRSSRVGAIIRAWVKRTNA